ncbi:MAG: ABC transporter [Halioglobus sp.]|nr:ABC transporter [Halioglobus sp.]|tara:strand:- start:1921 stop:2697 length:777 start_codon:yes stop_codon:yes gene_type:complete
MSFAQYYRLADVMARMALRADATKFYLGYIWWVLEPMLYVAVLYLVFAVILGTRQPDFLFFLMTGKLAYNWFSKSVTLASNSIVAGKGLVGKINVSKTLFPLAAVQEGMYKQLAVFTLLAVVLFLGGFKVTVTWIYIIPVVLVNYVMILACAYLGATLVCLVRDFQPVISLTMIFLLFTSGVFWDVRGLGDPDKVEAVLMANPLAFMLDAYRQVLMYSTPPDMLHLLSLAAGFGALLCLMVLLMRRHSQFLALRALTA